MQALASEVGTAMRDVDPMDVLNAARKVQRAFRSYKGRSNRPAKKRMRTKGKMERRVYTGVKNTSAKVGQTPPTGPAPALNLGELVISDFPWPLMATNNTNLRRRESNTVHVKGIKLCRQFQYARVAGAGDVGPIEVHYAILQLKNDEDNTELAAELVNNFFRNYSTTTQNSQDFPGYGPSSQWDMALNCLPINPNNKVTVMTHRKKILLPADTNTTAARRNIWTIDEYMKINKPFSFKENNNGLPSRRIFEVYWCNTQTPFEFPADPSVGNYIETDKMHTMYYGNTHGQCC